MHTYIQARNEAESAKLAIKEVKDRAEGERERANLLKKECEKHSARVVCLHVHVCVCIYLCTYVCM
jgi:hypothetical protein